MYFLCTDVNLNSHINVGQHSLNTANHDQFGSNHFNLRIIDKQHVEAVFVLSNNRYNVSHFPLAANKAWRIAGLFLLLITK